MSANKMIGAALGLCVGVAVPLLLTLGAIGVGLVAQELGWGAPFLIVGAAGAAVGWRVAA